MPNVIVTSDSLLCMLLVAQLGLIFYNVPRRALFLEFHVYYCTHYTITRTALKCITRELHKVFDPILILLLACQLISLRFQIYSAQSLTFCQTRQRDFLQQPF